MKLKSYIVTPRNVCLGDLIMKDDIQCRVIRIDPANDGFLFFCMDAFNKRPMLSVPFEEKVTVLRREPENESPDLMNDYHVIEKRLEEASVVGTTSAHLNRRLELIIAAMHRQNFIIKELIEEKKK